MLDFAISMDTDADGVSIVETNHGLKMKSPDWTHDCEFQLVTFSPSGRKCSVVRPNELTLDLACALEAIDSTGMLKGRKPAWYRRLAKYAAATSPTNAPTSSP